MSQARIRTSEDVIRENAKVQAKEITALRVEIARKDARIKELEEQL